MIELSDIERKLEELDNKLENNTLAMEMLKELKKSAKRWFILTITFALLFFATVIGVLIYESQFETITEETTQETHYTENSEITQTIN